MFGATGFVGALTVAYLAEHAPASARIGLAGRSPDKLTAIRAALGERARHWPLLVADTAEPDDMAALAASARVVASTVGPYAKYGLPLVEACAEAGTDYCDLTGEVLFVRQSIDMFHKVAASSGARIVHSCGFDSVPSDLGVLMLHEAARADSAGELTDTALLVVSMRGGISGGTVDSLRGQIATVRKDKHLRALSADAYSLSPERAAEPDGQGRDQLTPTKDPLLGRWTAPFVMSPYNTRIVRRSNALSGYAYGRSLHYREVLGVGTGPAAPALAGAVTATLGALTAGLALKPSRMVLDRVLPKPGKGPSAKTQRNGHFRIEVHTRTSSGARYLATVAAQGDPGYAATAVMLGESALALAFDPSPGMVGVLTPATGIGRPLVERLRAAGFIMQVEQRAG